MTVPQNPSISRFSSRVKKSAALTCAHSLSRSSASAVTWSTSTASLSPGHVAPSAPAIALVSLVEKIAALEGEVAALRARLDALESALGS